MKKRKKHSNKRSAFTKKPLKLCFKCYIKKNYENKFPVRFTSSLLITQNEPLSVPIKIKVLKVLKRSDKFI